MRNIYFLLSIIFTSLTASATIHNITNVGNTFSPSSLSTVLVGDTIRWTIASGTHNVTGISVPVGAASISSGTLGTGGVYDYKVTVVGEYVYECTFHGGMTASFAATNPVGLSVAKIAKQPTDFKAYPNPFKTKITIPTKNAESIEIFSVLGEKVKTIDTGMIDKVTIDLSDLRKGVYFYTLKDESGVIETRKIIKSE